jgi:hypothetical protein
VGVDNAYESEIMTHEWVEQGYCIAFVTVKGVLLDLDNMTFRKAKWIAETLLKKFRLEDYLLIRSSRRSYHAVFNKYLSWKKITEVLFSMHECIRYAVQQMQNGHLALRISKKNGKNKPKILLKVGKTDKLITDYLEVFEKFHEVKDL